MGVTTNGDAGEQPSNESGASGDPIRVLVADDHVLYRRGLELVLGQESDITIVGEAGDGVEAIRRTEELLPDVVLMDVRMPERRASRPAWQSRSSRPRPRSSC